MKGTHVEEAPSKRQNDLINLHKNRRRPTTVMPFSRTQGSTGFILRLGLSLLLLCLLSNKTTAFTTTFIGDARRSTTFETSDSFFLGSRSKSALDPQRQTQHADDLFRRHVQKEASTESTAGMPESAREAAAAATATSSPQGTSLGEQPLSEAEQVGLKGIQNIIAVSSCKGGVGKSTTSVNLAYSLRQQGYSVGILDADIYGPSLPTMVEVEDDLVKFVGRQIEPLQGPLGVKLMSFGFINEESTAAVMRGPMIDQLLQQFLTIINWGPYLDYLILDMPPGTGDIQLTLSQKLAIKAAVIVTTPQQLSYEDVTRGIEMFNQVNIPCIAVVENMSYFEPPPQSTTQASHLKASIETKLKEYNVKDATQLTNELIELLTAEESSDKEDAKIWLFGKGHLNRLKDQFGIQNTFQMPLMSEIASSGDSGKPFVLNHPESTQSKLYNDLATAVVDEVKKLKDSKTMQISYFETTGLLHVIDPELSQQQDETKDESEEEEESKLFTTLSPVLLRQECKCAACVEELTGRQILDKKTISSTVRPRGPMEPYGNYAISINWSDGHRSLYPYRQIRELIVQQQKDEES